MTRSVEGVEGESVNVDFLFEAMPGEMPEVGAAVQTAFRIAGDGRLFAWHAEGKLKPLVSQTFPLARGGEAIDALGQRKAVGKVVVQVKA